MGRDVTVIPRYRVYILPTQFFTHWLLLIKENAWLLAVLLIEVTIYTTESLA